MTSSEESNNGLSIYKILSNTMSYWSSLGKNFLHNLARQISARVGWKEDSTEDTENISPILANIKDANTFQLKGDNTISSKKNNIRTLIKS